MSWKKLQITKSELSDLKNAFRKRARLYIDENIEEEITEALKTLGWNIKTYKDFSLAGHPDENHFAKAKQLNRILITQDDDYWDNRRFPIDKHPGVIILQYQNTKTVVQGIRFIADVIVPFAEIWHSSKVKIKGEQVIVFSKNTDKGTWETTKYKLDKNGTPFIWCNPVT